MKLAHLTIGRAEEGAMEVGVYGGRSLPARFRESEHKPMRIAHINGVRNSLKKPDGPAPPNRHQSNEIEINMNRIIEANFLPPPVEEAEEKARILIIDDNRDFTYSAKRALERTRRYSVWEENDPAKAHQTAQRVKPDLILLDIAMPETGGGEVAAQIESDPTLHRTPIIFLTGLVTKAEARSGLRIQGHPFLAKPISVPDLVAGLEQHLPARAGSSEAHFA